MCGQGEHDQISIQPIQTVLGIWIPARPVTLLANVTHHLVLTLAWHICI